MSLAINIRSDFPALNRQNGGRETVYLDGPAGTQVPTAVMDAMNAYYMQSNANTHGFFAASAETDELLTRTRKKVAALLGAPSDQTISFGANMTSLNFALSRGLSRIFDPGDEVLISQLDHEANRGPWLALQEKGIVVKEIPLLASGQLDYEALPALLSEKTRLVAVGLASNILGTVNDIKRIKSMLADHTWLLLDAVHFAPHFRIDVGKLDCDFLLCSAYKFYGPHVGLLYSREGLLDRIPTDRLRTQEQHAPYRIETGTLNHAAIAGVEAAIDYLTSLGSGTDLKSKLNHAFSNIGAHERELIVRLATGLQQIDGLQIIGPNFDQPLRAPTIVFTHEKLTPTEICRALGKQGINAWDGHFYAIRTTEVLGLLERGGVTRMGMAIYNTMEEIEYTIASVRQVVEVV